MNGDRVTYLDSSALVKLVVSEPESGALRRYLRPAAVRASSVLVTVEVIRHARRHGPRAHSAAKRLLRGVELIDLDGVILDAASVVDPLTLRGVDPIHLATALSVTSSLDALVTYDQRMQEAAKALGLPVAAPA